MSNEEHILQENPEVKLGTVGGEALMEGIMMRGPKGAAVSLRLPDGSIETTIKKVKLPTERCKAFGWPLIRGPVNLVYSMAFGYKCMMESAEKATQGIMDQAEAEGEEMGKLDRWIEKNFGPKMMTVITVIGGVLGVALALGLFFVLPTLAYDGIVRLVGDIGFRAVIEGVIRIILFVLYMALSSLVKDIRRTFEYHGAEHKAIFCYESGLPLTIENVKAQSRFHPRCGTSFLFFVILLSILVSALLSVLLPTLWLSDIVVLRVALRFLILPLLMALGYEFIRFAGKHLNNPLVRVLSFPGISMQRITTKEPDDEVIEVGITALKAALGMPYKKESDEPEHDDTPGDTTGEQKTVGSED